MATIDEKLDYIIVILQKHDERFQALEQRMSNLEQRTLTVEREVKAIYRIAESLQNLGQSHEIKFFSIESKIAHMDEQLLKIYESRKQVTVDFTRAFALGNAGISAVVSLMVAMFVKR
ncbi:hypothetical protein HZA38_02375 [Candidatus Peregrinibacteria bacterium]|nr:hypothetical protein [Candidatus Peregrinibacteria bacterium]